MAIKTTTKVTVHFKDNSYPLIGKIMDSTENSIDIMTNDGDYFMYNWDQIKCVLVKKDDILE